MISFKKNLRIFIFQNFYEIRFIFYRSNTVRLKRLKWKLFAFLCMLILFLFFRWLGGRAFRKIHGLLRYCFSKRRIIGSRQLNFTKDIVSKQFERRRLPQVSWNKHWPSWGKTLIYNTFLLLDSPSPPMGVLWSPGVLDLQTAALLPPPSQYYRLSKQLKTILRQIRQRTPCPKWIL